MLKNREKLYQIYHALLSMVLTWALTLVINQYYELRVPAYWCALSSLLLSLAVYLFDQNSGKLVSYLLVISIIPLVALIFWLLELNPLTWLEDYFHWFETYNGSEELFVAHFSKLTIFLIAMLGEIIFYLLTKMQKLKIILAALLLITLITLSVNKINVNKLVVGIGLFYMLSIIIELYGVIYSKKAGKPDKREGILYLAPVCLLLAILAISLPSKAEPIQWKTFKNIYYRIRDQIDIWRTDVNYYLGNLNTEFNVSMSGYSEGDSELGNSQEVIKDSKVALKISGMDKGRSVYLIGSVSDVYTGSSWIKSQEDYIPGEKDYRLDYLELYYALARQDLKTLESKRFILKKTIKIQYNNIKTKSLFYPIKSSGFTGNVGDSSVSFESPRLTYNKAKGKGTTYESTFYELNLREDAFHQMLREADDFSYDNPEEINQDSAKWLRENYLNGNFSDILNRRDLTEILSERSDLIYEKYTVLPESLPDRVKELALEITKGYDNSYDKLKAIEVFLLGYQYNLKPGKLPEGKDFVDYFLFEKKEGYCTSFASAMAIMGRCIGIPTRYVEGYVAKFNELDSDNMYKIKNSQAHAWAEAYIEGVGWIPLEATASYYETRYTKWPELPKVNNEGIDYSKYYKHQEEDSQLYQPEDTEETEKKPNIYYKYILGLSIVASSVILIIVTVIVYYVILKYRYKKDFHNADYSRKMYMHFLRILTLLKHFGYSLEPEETILMLAQRVKDQFKYEKIIFLDIANIFMKYRYAGAEVSAEEFEKVDVYYHGLSLKRLKDENRLKIWFEELLFLSKRR